jgi:DNA (cytosine-5)-methyltransferase 1
MNKLRVLELFAGIGACSKALEKLGIEHEIVDAVEIDKYAVKSFNAIHNTNFEPQDITQWDKDIEVDLVMHGSPCQDFSLSGKQAGGDEGSGTRSSLMYETIRIVKKLKPKYVIWENVKNLLSKKHKHNFDAYIETMGKLGYKNYYQVLNAKDYGIPQNRERVFTISIRNDIDKEFIFPEKQELKLKLKDMLEDNVDEKYYLSDKMINYISARGTANFRNPDCKINLDIARPLTTDQNKRAGTTNYLSNDLPDNYDLNDTIKIKNATKKGYLEAAEGDGIDLAQPNSKTRRGRVQKESIQTLTTQNNLGVCVIGNYMPSGHEASRIVDNEGIAPTIKENHGTVTATNVYSESEKALFTEDGNIRRYINSDKIDEFKEGQMATTTFPNGYGHGPRTHDESIFLNCIDRPSVKQNLRIRKLTPCECWKLMGFDIEDFKKAEKVNSNAQLYKQAGNSIVVNVLMAIFNELLKKEGE